MMKKLATAGSAIAAIMALLATTPNAMATITLDLTGNSTGAALKSSVTSQAVVGNVTANLAAPEFLEQTGKTVTTSDLIQGPAVVKSFKIALKPHDDICIKRTALTAGEVKLTESADSVVGTSALDQEICYIASTQDAIFVNAVAPKNGTAQQYGGTVEALYIQR